MKSMVMYAVVKLLSQTEAAYIAGIFDGEGTITLTRKAKGKPRHLALTVSSCEYDLLAFLLKTIKAGLITSKRTYKNGHSEAYTYRLLNRQALALLIQIAPHLRTYKRRRAKIVLKDYVRLTPRNGKYSLQQLKLKEKFEKRFFDMLPNSKSR